MALRLSNRCLHSASWSQSVPSGCWHQVLRSVPLFPAPRRFLGIQRAIAKARGKVLPCCGFLSFRSSGVSLQVLAEQGLLCDRPGQASFSCAELVPIVMQPPYRIGPLFPLATVGRWVGEHWQALVSSLLYLVCFRVCCDPLSSLALELASHLG